MGVGETPRHAADIVSGVSDVFSSVGSKRIRVNNWCTLVSDVMALRQVDVDPHLANGTGLAEPGLREWVWVTTPWP